MSTAIHEMAHSWTGNLVSCKNWSCFWLNEGFTVLLENMAIKEIYGNDVFEMIGVLDSHVLIKTIKDFGE